MNLNCFVHLVNMDHQYIPQITTQCGDLCAEMQHLCGESKWWTTETHENKEYVVRYNRWCLCNFSLLCTLWLKVMALIQDLPVPVIAMVNGIATAAGCQLVATCDIAVATDKSSFATPGVNVGLFCSTPGVAIGRAVTRKVNLHT